MQQFSSKLNRDGRRRALTLLLLFALLLSSMTLASPVLALTAGEISGFTVQFGAQEFLEDLQTSHAVFDLYRVGTAPSDPGGSWKLFDRFGGAVISANLKNSERLGYSRSLGKAVLESEEPVIRGGTIGMSYARDDAGQPLLTGLYLLIVHGSDLSRWAIFTEDEAAPGLQEGLAVSDLWEYVFAPELLFVPEGSTVLSVKVSRNERFGNLEIVKDLERYENSEPAIFVYDITARRNGEVVYTNVASITWPEQRSVLIEGLPGGSEVTVTEIYTGSHYTLVSQPEQSAVIEANQIASVRFTNDYDGTGIGGHGIENRFTYVEETDGGQTKTRWSWSGEEEKP